MALFPVLKTSKFLTVGNMLGNMCDLIVKCLRQVTKGHLYHLLGVLDYYVMFRHRAQTVLLTIDKDQILNMFNTECQLTLRRIRRRLCRISRRLHYTRTHTLIVEEWVLESLLESADYSAESANSNANSPKISVWVRALSINKLNGVLVI